MRSIAKDVQRGKNEICDYTANPQGDVEEAVILDIEDGCLVVDQSETNQNDPSFSDWDSYARDSADGRFLCKKFISCLRWVEKGTVDFFLHESREETRISKLLGKQGAEQYRIESVDSWQVECDGLCGCSHNCLSSKQKKSRSKPMVQ